MQTGLIWLTAASLVAGLVRKRLRVRGWRGNDRLRPANDTQEPGPTPVKDGPAGEESLYVWGFKDTEFTVDSEGTVSLSGKRYDLCGQRLVALLPWVRKTMSIELPPDDRHAPSYPPAVPQPVENAAFVASLNTFLEPGQIDDDAQVRLRHGHGHTQEEMYAIKYGVIGRVPDLVVYPKTEEQVQQLVRAAAQHSTCLIPYGGGTSVTEALACPENERRTVVSVDMQRMSRILWVDPVNRMACIEAGALGRDIVASLATRGFTMGHEPDSVEFSTLGGWIATNASGMKKNKYGNIEDLVLDMHVVTHDGSILCRKQVAPRESVGNDPRQWMFGSEGAYGIVTQAVVKLFPLPESQVYGSIIFPSFEEGVAFMYELGQTSQPPASVRLVDNVQFQFSLALKGESVGLKAVKSRLEKLYVTQMRGFKPDRMVACTLVFEGGAAEVQAQQELVYNIASAHGGLKAGAENGKRGYALTYGIAYIRDFVMAHYILAESFETSVPWSRTLELCDRVKRRLQQEHAARNLPGKPFITCRVTQIYTTGVCVYFYFGFYHKGVDNPSQVYSEIEAAARDEILQSGGSLSHHHGIGKLRQRFLPEVMSAAALAWNKRAKIAVDPDNVFGCGNQTPLGQ